MRLRFAALALVCGLCNPLWGQQMSPYKATITANDAEVRSGPGESYYATEKVPTGTAVEVYRRDPDGWCAIRPLPNSFSWVSGRYLKLGEKGLATATGEYVPVGIGSQLSDSRSVNQVSLHRGEVVEILGSRQSGTGTDSETWYKIAPPAGEFRWISGKYLDSGNPSDGVRTVSGQSQNTSATSAAVSVSSAGAAGQVSPPTPLSPEKFQVELDDVNTELSIMLAEDPAVWKCDELARRALGLFSRAQTALQRGQARVLVNRLAQADDIKRQFDAVDASRAEQARRSGHLSEFSRQQVSAIRGGNSQSRFDGIGRLARANSSGANGARYALVDDRGSVLSYVSPAPGVNMQHYLGHRVGVSGARLSPDDERTPYVVAKHVTVLDAVVR